MGLRDSFDATLRWSIRSHRLTWLVVLAALLVILGASLVLIPFGYTAQRLILIVMAAAGTAFAGISVDGLARRLIVEELEVGTSFSLAQSREALTSIERLREENESLRSRLREFTKVEPEPELDSDASAKVSRLHLTTSFNEFARRNDRVATALLVLGVLVLSISVGFAFYLLNDADTDASVVTVVTRLSISLPGAVLFAVLMRESAQRRRYGAWGRLTAIQAETLGPYTTGLPDELRHELLMEYGRAVFRGGDIALETGAHGAKSEASQEQFDVVAAAFNAIAAANTAARSQLSGPSASSQTQKTE